MTVTVSDMQRRVTADLSMVSRVAYTLLLLAATAMAGLTGALAATEPRLPLRTTVALIVMSVVGVTWAAVAFWVLSRRRVLLAQHRVVVSWVATTVTGAFFGGAVLLQLPLRAPAIGVSSVMLVAAIASLLHARRRQARSGANQCS